MSKKIRLIARLDVKDTNLVKGIQLEGLRKLGDPNAFAKEYYEAGIDELLYIDIVASLYNRNNLSEMEMNIEIQEMELDRKAAALRNEKYLDSLGAGTPDKVREAELDYTVSSLKLEDNRRKFQNQRDRRR